MEDLFTQVENVIEKIRPFIQADGGDVTLTRIEGDVAYVQVYGACVGCMTLDFTLKEAIQRIVMEEVPGISSVELDSNF